MRHPDRQFAVVIWDDAHKTHEELHDDEINHKPSLCQTYGWIIKNDDVGITVASEWGPEDGIWRDSTFVPHGMVREVVLLSLSRRAGGRKARKEQPGVPETVVDGVRTEEPRKVS
jgi:hypothetical protein